MASLLTRVVPSFDAIKPVPNLTGLDGEFNQLEGGAGVFNGGTTAFKLLIKTSDGTDPPVDSDQVGAGPLARFKQNGSTKASISNAGDLTANGVTGSAGVYTFSNIPVLPASSPVGANDATRKQYVDDKATFFSLPWKIDDPSTAATGTPTIGPIVRVPAIASGFVTRIHALFNSGSHTSGGSVTFTLQKNFLSVSGADVLLNNTNNTGNTWYTTDFSDASIADGDSLSVFISARSGTITERDVTVIVEGYQKVKSM